MSLAIPLAGGDRIKIAIYFLVLAGTMFFAVIPILNSLAGIYIDLSPSLVPPLG